MFDEVPNNYLAACREQRKGKKGHVNSKDQAVGEKLEKEIYVAVEEI
jgi:hypothetical protein